MKKKTLIIVFSIVVLVLVSLGVALVLWDKPDSNPVAQTDAEKFAEEYEIEKENVFVYRDADAIIKIMEKGTGVVYLGFPECPWCKAYVKYLNEVAKEVGIEKIYYYNILNDRKDNTPEYQKMVSLLEDYLQLDDEANARIYVPNVSFHIDGFMIGNDCETSLDTHGFSDPKDYWTDNEVKDLKKTLKRYMEDVYDALSVCTDCNK